MKHHILAKIQSMSQQEISEMIPPDTIARIKKSDPSAEFYAYVVGHEGEAHAQELSFGKRISKAFKYMADVVIGLGNRLSYGTPAFEGHGQTNDHSGRERIGELVGKAVRMVKGKVSAIAAFYIYPNHRSKHLDIASIEANIEYVPKSELEADVLQVQNISGIALGSSREDKPAFSGATLLGIVQAFSTKQEGENKMKLEDIKAALADGTLKHSDLVGLIPSDILMASDPVKNEVNKHQGHARRVEDQLKGEREKIVELTRTVEESNTKLKAANEKLSGTSSRSMFDKSVTDRKLSDQQKSFIEKKLGEFKSGKEGAELQGDFDRFMDAAIKDYDETAKLFGVKTDQGAAGETKPNGGAGATDGKGGVTDDALDPSKNELIPTE